MVLLLEDAVGLWRARGRRQRLADRSEHTGTIVANDAPALHSIADALIRVAPYRFLMCLLVFCVCFSLCVCLI